MKLLVTALATALLITPASPKADHSNIWAKPSAWCGWYARTVKNVADPAFNVALHWLQYGHATSPRVGAVVVWSRGHGKGHVGIIRGGPNSKGQWLVESGNDGHAVRTRYRSVANAVGFRI